MVNIEVIGGIKLKRTEPGGSILLLKLTKLTNLTKPKLMKKNVIQNVRWLHHPTKFLRVKEL